MCLMVLLKNSPGGISKVSHIFFPELLLLGKLGCLRGMFYFVVNSYFKAWHYLMTHEVLCGHST